MLLKNISSVMKWHNYLCLCALLFWFSVSWSSKMEVGVTYFETHGSTQPHVAFCTLIIHSCCFFYSRTCTAPSSLAFQKPVFVVSSLFTWLMDGACFSCLVVWVSGILPTSWIWSLTYISLNGQCYNSECKRQEW